MSNDVCGTLKCVAKSKETLERIHKILNYKDDEYFIHRCKQCDPCADPEKDGEFWVQEFYIDGAWSCEPFFSMGDNPDNKIVLEQTWNPDKNDYEYKYGTAHLTSLPHLCKVLDFGCELFACEGGCCFCEHAFCDHTGEDYQYETDDYDLNYPKDENGEEDYDAEPEEVFGLEYYGEYCSNGEIYETEH